MPDKQSFQDTIIEPVGWCLGDARFYLRDENFRFGWIVDLGINFLTRGIGNGQDNIGLEVDSAWCAISFDLKDFPLFSWIGYFDTQNAALAIFWPLF